jgi:hypothetical protein
MNEFKEEYQRRTKLVKNENVGLLADLLLSAKNVNGFNEVRQREMHIVELLEPKPNFFEVQIAIEKLKGHKSPSSDHIPAEMILLGGNILRSEMHKLINSI